MATQSLKPSVLRFGIFELDYRSGELRRGGVGVRLPPQPFKVLWLLASRPGEVVSRDEIRDALTMPSDVPLVLCDARSRESAKEVLITLVEYVVAVHRRGRGPVAIGRTYS